MIGEFSDTADRSAKLRRFFARYVAERGGVRDPRVEQAFAAIPREPFAGPAPWFVVPTGPWSVWPPGPRYLQTPDDDQAFLYQDFLIALDPARGINIGEPSLHAHCIDALAPQAGETVLQIGAGSGYYTAILAHLVGPNGRIHAFEIEPELAARAARNLAEWPWVEVQARSGTAGGLPAVDAIYVNAGITQPDPSWLEALRNGGRLLFPLQPERGFGAMLLVEKPRDGGVDWPARFVTRAGFIGCQGQQVKRTGRRLAAAFARGGWNAIRSFRLGTTPDESCWFRGDDWWLSTHAVT